jgi:amino acid permease
VAFFAVAAIFVLGLNVSSNDPLLKLSLYNRTEFAGSPFILMINRAGIGSADSALSAILLVVALSSANAHLYIAVIFQLSGSD